MLLLLILVSLGDIQCMENDATGHDVDYPRQFFR